MSTSYAISALRAVNRPTRGALLLASSMALWAGDAARATPVGMPAGSTVWMEMASYSCEADGDSDCTGSNQPGPNPPNGIPLTTFSRPGGSWVTASAEVQPDRVRAFVSGYGGGHISISLRDTYTVHGTAAGAFDVTVHLAVSGTASSLWVANTNGLVGAGVELEIGTFATSTDPAFHEQWRIMPFGPENRVRALIPSTFNPVASFSVPIAAETSYTRSTSVGDVFDIGYGVGPGLAWGTVDVLDTAVISFDLPEGVYLTSALGGTFGTVPEPSTALLLASGLAGVAFAGRKRASHR